MVSAVPAPAEEVRHLTVKETAAEIRRAVRAAFPGVKFSVRMATGSAYGWVRVSWADGPRHAQVREVVAPFESSRFDGMDDAYHRVPQTGPVRYSCRGVNNHREDGPQGLAHAVEVMRAAGAHVELVTTPADRLKVLGMVPGPIAAGLEVANVWGGTPAQPADVEASFAAAQIIGRTDFTSLPSGAEEG